MTTTADFGFAASLDTFGERLAVVAPDGTEITYRELENRVSTVVRKLGPVRRLVLLATANDVDSLITYLAALRGGHPVLLAAGGQVEELTKAYDPDVVINDGWDERRQGTAHELHPDLAVLLSTSGSTGSPKLVRLSADNLRANAAAIAEYLDIRATDRAITSVPMHYCYGLSVINSNLSRGASVVLTDRSVVDPKFWTLVREHHVTSLHGVPHTFDLLEATGFDQMNLPSLRYVTQAGGRMDPSQVVRFAALGETKGWRFFVMYGQTEATARMAYLAPELAREHPTAIGVPIPGGQFDIADDGELIYRGPNVMLGYAHSPADLALGHLKTGDLARRTPEGLYELIGRKSRFLKLFGLRVDLGQVERVLAAARIEAACAGTDDALVIAVRGKARRARELARARFGLPAGSVRIVRVREFPRLPNGKIDYQAIAEQGRTTAATGSVRQVFATVLGAQHIPDDATFVSLGGDSLCYIQMSVALERVLGRLPDNWPAIPVGELERRRQRPPRVPMVETNIVLRALAIVLVVGTHVMFFTIHGGAHLLLLVAGWNFARFLLPGSPGRMVRSAAFIAVPTVAWLVYRASVTDDVKIVNVLLVSNFFQTGAAGYWFIEVLVHALLVLAILFAIPAVRRVERAHGFAFALVVLGVTLLLRIGFDDTDTFHERHLSTLGAMWFFALGWVARQAITTARKCLVLTISVLLIPGVFDDIAWEAVVLAGLVILVVLTRVPIPRPVVGVVSLAASASLYIYLTHYAIFPVLLVHVHESLVVVLSMAVGVLVWQGTQLGKNALARIRPNR